MKDALVIDHGSFSFKIGPADYTKPPTMCKPVGYPSIMNYANAHQTNILLTIPPYWSKKQISQMVQILFEQCNAPSLFLIDQPLAVLYACGINTGLVIDIGHSHTTIVPIFENVIVRHAITSLPLGGADIDSLLSVNAPEFAAAFKDNLNSSEFAAAFKENLKDGLSAFTYNNHNYSIPCQTDLSSVLFDPSLVGKQCPSLTDAILSCIQNSCTVDKRLQMWDNLVLTGGCSLIPGLSL
jgi:actin-related protein